MTNPILVEVLRGTQVESVHRGSVAVVDGRGQLRLSIGDVQALTFPRSAYKPLQVLPLLMSGAGAQLDDQSVSLACASHSADHRHRSQVQHWLRSLRLPESALACGPGLPEHIPSQIEYLRTGDKPAAHLHNCSGKHCGMLALCVDQGWSIEGYDDYDHHAQRSWRTLLGELAEVDTDNAPWDRDGCGLPALAFPLYALALGFAKLANPSQQSPALATAMRRLHAAVAAQPWYIAGQDRLCSELNLASGGQVLAKVGAEGVYAAALPEQGLGIAIKCDDGARRGAEVILGATLAALAHPSAAHPALQRHFSPKLYNSQGVIVGHARPVMQSGFYAES